MKYLGVDYGTKRVGIALSDESGAMGFPHSIIENSPRLLEAVVALIQENGVGAVVIGESHDLSGRENPVAEAAHAFGNALLRATGLPVYYESEVFTSEAARQSPHKQEKSRAPKSRAPIDDSAAALILTAYLSRTNHG